MEKAKAVKACPSNKALSIANASSITPVDMRTIKIASLENGVRNTGRSNALAQMAGALSQPRSLVRYSEMSDRNRTCQPGKVTPCPDVQPGPTTWQTPFSGQGIVPLSMHIVNKFRRPKVLQLNIEGFTASKMNVLHHLAVQYEAIVTRNSHTFRKNVFNENWSSYEAPHESFLHASKIFNPSLLSTFF